MAEMQKELPKEQKQTSNDSDVKQPPRVIDTQAEKSASINLDLKKKLNPKEMSPAMLVTVTLLLLTVGAFGGYVARDKAGDEGDLTTKNIDTNRIANEESLIIDVVEEASNAVVSIAVNNVKLDPKEGAVDVNSNIGSGFIVDKTGLILTNRHVVSDLNVDYTVITKEGKEFEVKEIQRDPLNDIAILKIDPGKSKLEALELGNSEELKQGQLVIAIGTPLGEFEGSVTTGVISGLHRSISAGSGSSFTSTAEVFEDVIQTDAAINPGNSGGPLLNSHGQVIGINFATSSGADNISFSIPINNVKPRIAEYRTYGKFKYPTLGIEYNPISEADARFYQNVVPGALVVRVVEGGAAELAGVKKFDIITKIDGEEVGSSLRNIILSHEVGDTVKLTIWREGKSIELKAVLKEA
ncbi:MAG: hypothetical protein Fur003_3530 [Candidatus Dojkabacteria bacterium]